MASAKIQHHRVYFNKKEKEQYLDLIVKYGVLFVDLTPQLAQKRFENILKTFC